MVAGPFQSPAAWGAGAVPTCPAGRIFAKRGSTFGPAREEAAHREEDAEHEAALGDWHHAASNWEAAAKGGPTRRTAFLARDGARGTPTARPGGSSTTRTTRRDGILPQPALREGVQPSRGAAVAKALQNLGMRLLHGEHGAGHQHPERSRGDAEERRSTVVV